MSVLIVVEPVDGLINKGGFELATYGKKTAVALSENCIALVIGSASNMADLGIYGADEIQQLDHTNLTQFDSQTYAKAIHQVVQKLGCKTVILRHSANGKSIIGRLAVMMKAGSVTGVNSLPDTSSGFKVSKSAYSGKAIAQFEINTPTRVFTLIGNAIQPEKLGSAGAVNKIDVDVESPKSIVTGVNKVKGTIPLPEAELVVSAGRGMKGPENWGIVEDLAKVLGATTACSRPVADTGWRPHHEHVGQTGVAIRPNLYIAIGISGAIQHLAGVNNSKTIVVINKDPDAPFFKAADYGVIGDLFEVVPKLTEAIKRYKGQ